MAKHDETSHQQQAGTQQTALSRYEEGVLARALADLADAIRQQRGGGRAICNEATLAADEYRDIKSVLRSLFEVRPEDCHPTSTQLKKR